MINNEMQEDEIIVIRTLECDLCMRFDSIMLSKNEIYKRVNSNSLKIGSQIISHSDHLRIVYFDKDAKYLGDTISLSIQPQNKQNINYNIPILTEKSERKLNSIKKKMLNKLVKTNQNLCIVGPTMAGKTSLSILLSTGIPERYSKRTTHSATMGKSVKRLKLGRSLVTIYDLGGQKNFWEGWEEVIKSSNKIIFIMDGSANNPQEISEALKLVINSREDKRVPILILINKYDLYFDGYTNQFLHIDDLNLEMLNGSMINIWMLESSIFNGVCYNFNGKKEEIPLSNVILKFLEY